MYKQTHTHTHTHTQCSAKFELQGFESFTLDLQKHIHINKKITTKQKRIKISKI